MVEIVRAGIGPMSKKVWVVPWYLVWAIVDTPRQGYYSNISCD